MAWTFVRLRGPRRVPLGTRLLLRDWVRLIISVGGIGFAILLIMLLDAIRVGTVAKSTTYVDHVGADIFVARQGVTNMALAASVLPERTVNQIAAVDGVAQAAGIVRLPVIASARGIKRPITLIGYDPAAGLGGPWRLVDGRRPERDTEAVIDSALSRELGVGVGDTFQISDAAYQIVGTSGQTATIAGKYAFLTVDAVQSLLNLSDLVSFVLVRVEPGERATGVAARLNQQLPDITATTRAALSENDRDLLSSLFIAPINVASTVGLLVGLAIIGLTMYTTTAERLRDFGVLKAIGARNAFLFRTVGTQAAILGLAGFLAGVGAVRLMNPVIVHLVPDIGVAVTVEAMLRTLIEVIAMSLAGAVVPVARIARVDPLVVFRS